MAFGSIFLFHLQWTSRYHDLYQYIFLFSPLSKWSVLNACAPIIKKKQNKKLFSQFSMDKFKSRPNSVPSFEKPLEYSHNREEKIITVSISCDFKWPLSVIAQSPDSY